MPARSCSVIALVQVVVDLVAGSPPRLLGRPATAGQAGRVTAREAAEMLARAGPARVCDVCRPDRAPRSEGYPVPSPEPEG